VLLTTHIYTYIYAYIHIHSYIYKYKHEKEYVYIHTIDSLTQARQNANHKKYATKILYPHTQKVNVRT